MDQLLSGIAIAALSAITFVAYKHPEGFKRLLIPIRIIVPAGLVMAGIWDIAVGKAALALFGLIPAEKAPAAKQIVSDMQFLTGTVMAVYIGAVLYLEFLAILPILLADKEPPKAKD